MGGSWWSRLGRLCVLGGGLAVGLGGAAARADLVVNGSFESSWFGSVDGWSSTHGFEVGTATQMCGGIRCYGLDAAADGNAFLELNTNTYSSATQTITGLTVGQQYLLSWAYAGRQGSGPQQMDVSFAGVLVGRDMDSGVGAPSWQRNEVVVTATGTSAALTFAAIGVGGNPAVGNELDAVSLTTYVPEPGSLALCATGVAGALAWRRRRARTRRAP